jgi:putative methyltransferase (TIGR04325 family)
MSSVFRQVARLLLPPIVLDAIRHLRRTSAIAPAGSTNAVPNPPPAEQQMASTTIAQAESIFDSSVRSLAPEWEMVADAEQVWTGHVGWGHDSILRTQLNKWPDFLRSVEGSKPLGQSHEALVDAVPDCATHNTIMSFAYALGRLAQNKDAVSVLDWGGGLGHYYVYARALFPALRLDYVIKELVGFCAAGECLLPKVTYLSDEGRALARSYDFVFASSSLHYTRDCYGLLGRLCDVADWLMITRTPVVEHSDDFLVVQRPHMYGYMTEYPGWFVNRRRLLNFVSARGFALQRQFLVGEEANVPNAPEQARYCGFLFRRTNSAAGAL